METLGMVIALIGTVFSIAVISYALWNLFELLADAFDERDRAGWRQWS